MFSVVNFIVYLIVLSIAYNCFVLPHLELLLETKSYEAQALVEHRLAVAGQQTHIVRCLFYFWQQNEKQFCRVYLEGLILGSVKGVFHDFDSCL